MQNRERWTREEKRKRHNKHKRHTHAQQSVNARRDTSYFFACSQNILRIKVRSGYGLFLEELANLEHNAGDKSTIFTGLVAQLELPPSQGDIFAQYGALFIPKEDIDYFTRLQHTFSMQRKAWGPRKVHATSPGISVVYDGEKIIDKDIADLVAEHIMVFYREENANTAMRNILYDGYEQIKECTYGIFRAQDEKLRQLNPKISDLPLAYRLFKPKTNT